MTDKIIQLKITLNYIVPAIWRRFIVDSSYSLQELHDIIQIVMGWEHSHLYAFKINKMEYELPDDFGEDLFEAMGSGPKPHNVKKIKLSELNLKPKQKFYYTYDFGDNWEHTILVEKVTEITEEIVVPICVEPQSSGGQFLSPSIQMDNNNNLEKVTS